MQYTDASGCHNIFRAATALAKRVATNAQAGDEVNIENDYPSWIMFVSMFIIIFAL